MVHKFPANNQAFNFSQKLLDVYKKSCSLSISSKLFTGLLKQSKCVSRTYKTLNLKKRVF